MSENDPLPPDAAERRKIQNRNAQRKFRDRRNRQRISQALQQSPLELPSQLVSAVQPEVQTNYSEGSWNWVLQDQPQSTHYSDSQSQQGYFDRRPPFLESNLDDNNRADSIDLGGGVLEPDNILPPELPDALHGSELSQQETQGVFDISTASAVTYDGSVVSNGLISEYSGSMLNGGSLSPVPPLSSHHCRPNLMLAAKRSNPFPEEEHGNCHRDEDPSLSLQSQLDNNATIFNLRLGQQQQQSNYRKPENGNIRTTCCGTGGDNSTSFSAPDSSSSPSRATSSTSRSSSTSTPTGVFSSATSISSTSSTSGDDSNDFLPTLHIASFRGHTRVLALLLSRTNPQAHSVDIAERDSSGRTALHLAAHAGHADAARLLIQAANPCLGLTMGRPTPTSSSSQATPPSSPPSSLIQQSDRLVEQPVPQLLNMGDTLGRAPLHWAALQKHEAVLRVLVDAGADVNLCDSRGWTPLHAAVERGWDVGVQLLLARGANLSLKARKCDVWKREERMDD